MSHMAGWCGTMSPNVTLNNGASNHAAKIVSRVILMTP